ncbi:glutamate decarboxylase [Geopyxis carbonaria]|nr:glutamate decarboxylase [Geopyxis carbonaria]
MSDSVSPQLPAPAAAAGDLQPRAQEVQKLLALVSAQLLPFISSADTPDGAVIAAGPQAPAALAASYNLDLPLGAGGGAPALADALATLLRHSVNTWHGGFMDKLYASTDAVGVAAELVLAVLNTNVHVYGVSPALTVIERATAARLAGLFGFTGDRRGGMTMPGGSASNSTSMLIARNSLFPETKVHGNGARRFAVFTSAHGHYSVEKAAILCGFGSAAVWTVGVDAQGRMRSGELEARVAEATAAGCTPFYVNAGAGTTVLGSFDPFDAVADVCRRHGLWLHVDASWGGSVVFSAREAWRMRGAARADSLTVNPHKMLGVPVTCSFLLTNDRRRFAAATTLKAGYLFHENDDGDDGDDEVYDLAQMTMGCGRRGDALKMAFSWIYHGKLGYEEKINHAFDMAAYCAKLLSTRRGFHLVSESPPPCLQVCFFYTGASDALSTDAKSNTQTTRRVAAQLIQRGFMIDYSPDPVHGEFFRVVVNSRTTKERIESLIETIDELGAQAQS